MAKKVVKKVEQRKEFPWLIALAIIVLAAILVFFILKMQTPTGRAATGAATTFSVSPVSSGMVLAIAAAAMLLIAIFAGIGKREF